MKIYSMIAFAAIVIAASFGVVLPFLFSAASNVLVGLGILYLLALPVVLIAVRKFLFVPGKPALYSYGKDEDGNEVVKDNTDK